MDDKVSYTDQQAAVIACKKQNIRVRAFAGTGKSSTLVGFAKARPNYQMLYLAYNAPIAQIAKTKFPANVDCRTGHSLAYASQAKAYAENSGGKGLGDVKTVEVARALQTSPAHARIMLSALNNYFYSADKQITIDHVKDAIDSPKLADMKQAVLDQLLESTKGLWKRIKDPVDRTFKMPHDGYLKLFQLSEPKLTKYAYILFDEAQDANPVITAIVAAQEHAGKVFVGDSHQSIYEFRCASSTAGLSSRCSRLKPRTQSTRYSLR